MNESGPLNNAGAVLNHLQSPAEPSSMQAPFGAQTEAGRPAHESSTVVALTRRPNRAHAHASPPAAALAPPACPENPMDQHQHQHRPPRQHLEPSVPSALEEQNTVFQELRVIQNTMQSHLWPSLGPSASSSLEQQSLSSDETPRAHTDEEQAAAAAASPADVAANVARDMDVASGGAPAPDVRFMLEGDEDEGSPPPSVAIGVGLSPRAGATSSSSTSHGGHHVQQRAHFAQDNENDESKPLLLMTTTASGGDLLTPSSTSTTPRSSASALTPSHHELRGVMSSGVEDSNNSARLQQLASKFHVSRVPNSISPSQTVQSGSPSTASSSSPRPHQPDAQPNSWQWDFGNAQATGPQYLTDDL